MKKYTYIITLLIIFLLPIITYANCTEEEIKHFKKIEDKYKIEYTLDKVTRTYTITLSNPNPSKYVYEIQNIDMSKTCKNDDKNNTICYNMVPYSYTINIKGNSETCDKVLKRIFVKLKPYNKYSEDPLCEGIKEFTLCQETYEKEIDYETFVSRVNIYKEQKAIEEKNNKKKLIDFKKIKEFIEDNLYEVIVVTAFIILVIITIIITIYSVKKSRRLE